jgi:hypothetical protein
VISVRDLRVRLTAAKTRWAKLCAAPDRSKRRQWAKRWAGDHGAVHPRALSPQGLASDGFSLCRLDEGIASALRTEWASLKAAKEAGAATEVKQRSTGKAFFEEMLSDEDLRTFPAFAAAAIEEGVLQSVIHATGMVPHLESVDVLASAPTSASPSASQLWHYDVNDDRIIKLFIYLEDCWSQHGPFTFIPAEPSQRVSGELGHYVSDPEIAKHVPRAQWRTVEGAAGTAFLVDTGRCYHFGSRSEATRYAYIATYSSGLKFMRRSRMWAELFGERMRELTALQQRVLGAG